MKNYSLLVSLFLLLFTGCQKENVKNSLFYQVLHGDVKSVVAKTFEAKEVFGEVKKGNLLSYESFSNAKYEFDENGMLIAATEYDTDGEVSCKQVFEVDGYKTLSQSNYDGDGILTSKCVYTYDGDILSEQVEYDNEGNILSKWICQNDGKNITKREHYKYPTTNIGEEDDVLVLNCNECDTCSSASEADSVDVQKISDIDEKYLFMVVELEYVDGKLSSSIQRNKNNVYHTKYEWDGEYQSKVIHKDCVTEITRDKFGHFLKFKNGCRYNTGDEGFSGVDGWNYHYTYEYDEHNNWIKCIEYNTDKDKPTKIIEREFEYYK